MKWHRIVLVSCAMLTFHCGLAGAQDDEAGETDGSSEAAEEICINVSDLRTARPINNRFIYVQARGNRNYLFSMGKSCPRLRNADDISVRSGIIHICANNSDSVTYTGTASRIVVCPIDDIERVADREAANTIVDARAE